MNLGTKQIKNSIISLSLLLLSLACVDEYWPEMDKYENLLVVDGILTNGNEPVVVKLSISSSVNNPELIPVSNSEVYIMDELQVKTNLVEIEPGNYQSINGSFIGQIGKKYQLFINLSNGKSYMSDICSLKSPAAIDSVYGVPEETNEDANLPGIQFYIANHNNITDTSYYFWTLDQTYEYRSTFDIDYTWEGTLIPYPQPDSLRTCWKTKPVNDIIIASTIGYEENSVIQFPLNFVPTDTKILSIKYSLLVKQYTISKNAFDFYDAIQQQNIDQGSLWQQQPYQIVGNIYCTDKPDEPVLGYFIVAGMNKERIFVDRPDLIFSYSECTPDFDLRFISFTPQYEWPIYIDDIMFLGLAIAQDDACFDCRLEGGSLTPPDFWE